jgi:type IV secretion system protein VirB10
MSEHIDPKETVETGGPGVAPGAIPPQPIAEQPMKKGLPVIIALAVLIAIIGLANLGKFTSSAKAARTSAMAVKPAAPNANQVNGFETQQRQQAQKDEADRVRQQQLQAQLAQLAEEQGLPGPESPHAPPMTAAQRAAIYGADNPNAPKVTSGASQAQAEAKQRALVREQQHMAALASDTVAIDFAKPGAGPGSSPAPTPATTVEAETAEGQETAHGERLQMASAAEGHSSSAATKPGPNNHDPMAAYDFDEFQGRLYRIFEGSILEGVVTNHIDGALPGPMIVMLTTDYYSHDHQQLLLPQGTRLIGAVQSVGSVGQRKLMVVFNRAICPDGFSLDLNRFTGLDPLGTTGLATNVNNHYLSSFAAAAALGGLGGLAQMNSGSVLSASGQLRSGLTEQTAAESEQILDRFLSRLPIITVKEGSRARVYINHDLLIPSYAEHRVDPTL